MQKHLHEEILRGADAMQKLASAKILICGAGAVGSNLAVNLIRTGLTNVSVLDRDRVEEHNIGTQVYAIDDIGKKKSDSLRNLIYREVGVEITSLPQELNDKNSAKILRDYDLIVDTFDNSISRKLIFDQSNRQNFACVHAGLADSFGHVQWNEKYTVPSDAMDDICDYPLARNLIVMLVAVTSEVVIRFVLNSRKENFSITFNDLAVNLED